MTSLAQNFFKAFKWCLILVISASVLYILTSGAQTFLTHPASFLTDSATTSTKPIQHVYYLKIHKTGSTTMYSILAEYCRSWQLLPLLPVGVHINLSPPFYEGQVILSPKISKYDMVFNHHVFDSKIFKYLHNDTFKFTALREPFRHFVSSFNYFKTKEKFTYLKGIQLQTFLSNPGKYEEKGFHSYTNNRQSMDLGYNISRGFHDLSYIKHFIKLTEKRFDLVLISDFFHESLILLKRKLHWRTMDILYFKKNANEKKTRAEENFTDVQRQQHAEFSKPDIELYKHFLAIFRSEISQEKGLPEEVAEFELVLKQVRLFCNEKERKKVRLFVPAGYWTDEIMLVRSKCKWLKLDEVPFTMYLKRIQREILNS